MTEVVTEQDGFAEAVLLFDADLTAVEVELHAEDFRAMVEGSAGLDQFAASVVKGAFVVVGAALALRSVVLFNFKVNEEGTIDPSFNLPLRYLADNAGPGPDLGTGTIRLACRGQCPVPWHAVHLWQPVEGSEQQSVELVQKAVWRNRLGLKPTAGVEQAPDDSLELTENSSALHSVDILKPPAATLPENGSALDSVDNHRALETSLTEAFGDEGRLNLENVIRQHNDRVTQVSDKYRTEMLEQQQGYLDQIRSCREEIRELKAALRHEQQRSRRLQALLRGEP